MIQVTLPIFEIGRTIWYQVATSDFYTFTVSLLTFYSNDTVVPPKHFKLIRTEKNQWEYESGYAEIKKQLIEDIEAWIGLNVVIIST